MALRQEDWTPAQRVLAALSGDERLQIRMDKGLSRSELCRQTGVSRTTTLLWERGTLPHAHHAVRYCRALGLDVPA